ncbi:peroxidase P7-like [Cucurbita pepo subsp. pepo]|uniref:peroxidase P7-like n=1 Tax=Cucurbita pepo subsp. pepo TaxID=3664 RepID=UPI000C9D6596|nr:peroxidase P7-like [Cucurbita pepo subsp. pepo]
MNIIIFAALLFTAVSGTAAAGSSSSHLSKKFYHTSCPNLFPIVKSILKHQISKERRIGASLLRLHFHDCFVNGCDASVLLDDHGSFIGEQNANPNKNSLRSFNVIDKIKSRVEKSCPGVVSCADILTIAARDSVALLGGPFWNVKLGRRDSKTASFSDANSGLLPSPNSNLSVLISTFKKQGLSTTDMVALSGGHTIGLARCSQFKTRIYKKSNIDTGFAKKRQRQCPKEQRIGIDNLAPFDIQTPMDFDNKYFDNLIKKKGLLHSDQVLFSGGSTDSLVKKYSRDSEAFNRDFVRAMIKMAHIQPLTGSNGEIRKVCGRPN